MSKILFIYMKIPVYIYATIPENFQVFICSGYMLTSTYIQKPQNFQYIAKMINSQIFWVFI